MLTASCCGYAGGFESLELFRLAYVTISEGVLETILFSYRILKELSSSDSGNTGDIAGENAFVFYLRTEEDRDKVPLARMTGEVTATELGVARLENPKSSAPVPTLPKPDLPLHLVTNQGEDIMVTDVDSTNQESNVTEKATQNNAASHEDSNIDVPANFTRGSATLLNNIIFKKLWRRKTYLLRWALKGGRSGSTLPAVLNCPFRSCGKEGNTPLVYVARTLHSNPKYPCRTLEMIARGTSPRAINLPSTDIVPNLTTLYLLGPDRTVGSDTMMNFSVLRYVTHKRPIFPVSIQSPT
ncbi:hypothetical protein Sjap_025511 [Stephania japonica]|uniref:Uncharacterized protein n=1 Tax=Stephania japonica TaxID=461633 RepID=A0AAP0E4F4_9MAGN